MEVKRHEPSEQYPKGAIVIGVTEEELFGIKTTPEFVDNDPEYCADPLFDSGELRILQDVERELGTTAMIDESVRMAGDEDLMRELEVEDGGN